MKNFTPYVNVFQGCGEIALPKPEGIAAAWHFIKALTGNTTPAAVLPFGKYSCCMYTGGYPTGYGINKANYGGPIEKLSASPEFVGMSHFAQSGTGAIGVYYNYALTSPALSDKPDFSRRRVITESAEPGYYSVMIPDIFCEATVSQSAVLHRYTMAGNGNLSIDFSADGLYGGMGRAEVSGEVTACGKGMFAEMTLHGIKWYFAVTCEDALAVSVDGFVGSFAVTGGTHVMKLATSNKSMAHAEALLKKETRSFDVIRADAMKNWASALSAIEIDTDDARELEIFYSNFYHTLTKPSEFTGEAFLDGWGDDVPFMADLSTMWDIYKTQLPLVFTLYPDAAVKILGTLRRFAELTDSFPHCLMLASDLKTEASQARMLAEHTIADAFWRGIGADYAHLLCLCERDASRFAEDLSAPGGCRTAAHTVDITCAHRAMAGIARELGLDASAYDAVAAQYTKAYGEDGLMKTDSDYYEGNRFNYSFRPTPECTERIEKYGKDYYREQLRRFFGYTDAEDFTSRFEGYNNESDMEAPAFCHYIDRDMYCEILTAGVRYMFTDGRGGIPGNNDSGGLSSCYIWNVLGLFPVSGFDTMICGSPRYRRAVMHLPAGDLVIRREGEGIYTESVTFNGKPLEDFTLRVRDMMRGGELVFTMRDHA